MHRVMMRKSVFVFDDPMRRCYNGAFGDHHYEWGPWVSIWSGSSSQKAEHQLTFFRELNDYAVSQRGASAKCEFKMEEYTDDLSELSQ